MLAAFRNHPLQKGIELQRLNQMQGQPWTAKLPQVFHTDAARINLDPAWFSNSNVIIEFKSFLRVEWLRVAMRRS